MSYNQNYNYGNQYQYQQQYWDRDRDRDWDRRNDDWNRRNDRDWDRDWDDNNWFKKYKKKPKKLNIRKYYRPRRYNSRNYLYYWWMQYLYPVFGWRWPVPLTPYTPAQIYMPTDPNYPLQPNIYNT